MSYNRLKEDQYAEIRAAFLQLLKGYVSFTDEKLKSKIDWELDLGNIHEGAVIFGAERLKILLEQCEKGRQATIDDSQLNQTIINEISTVRLRFE